MHDKEKAFLEEAVREITNLRQANNYMASRLQMFDDMMLLIRTAPAGQGYASGAPDLVYNIEKHIAAAEQEEREMPQVARDSIDDLDYLMPKQR